MPESDFDFAVRFVRRAGREVVARRLEARRRRKPDGTDVTDVEEQISRELIEDVKQRSSRRDAVRGEEKSYSGQLARRVWIFDPIDGTREYLDQSVPFHLRTSCIGLSLMVRGQLSLAVVFNPFRQELFTVQRGGQTMLNGRPIFCSDQQAGRGVPYDYSTWKRARFNLAGLERTFGKPLGTHSAIYQACQVAMGRSAFAAFPGDTIHDIFHGAHLVWGGHGIVTDFRGRPLDWGDLSRGVLYANSASHAIALRALQSL